jgi:hypothetical protein
MISAYRSGETLIVFSPAVSAVRKASMREKGSQPPGEQKRTRTGGEPQPRRHTALLDTRHHSDTTLTAKTWTLSLGARPSAGPHEWQGQGSAVPIVFHPDNSHRSGGLRKLWWLRHSPRESWGAGAAQLCSRRDSNPQGGRIRVAVGAEVVFSALPVVWKGRAVVSGGTAV